MGYGHWALGQVKGVASGSSDLTGTGMRGAPWTFVLENEGTEALAASPCG